MKTNSIILWAAIFWVVGGEESSSHRSKRDVVAESKTGRRPPYNPYQQQYGPYQQPFSPYQQPYGQPQRPYGGFPQQPYGQPVTVMVIPINNPLPFNPIRPNPYQPVNYARPIAPVPPFRPSIQQPYGGYPGYSSIGQPFNNPYSAFPGTFGNNVFQSASPFQSSFSEFDQLLISPSDPVATAVLPDSKEQPRPKRSSPSDNTSPAQPLPSYTSRPSSSVLMASSSSTSTQHLVLLVVPNAALAPTLAWSDGGMSAQPAMMPSVPAGALQPTSSSTSPAHDQRWVGMSVAERETSAPVPTLSRHGATAGARPTTTVQSARPTSGSSPIISFYDASGMQIWLVDSKTAN